MEDSFQAQRESMVDYQIVARGIMDPCIVEAMRSVPRHEFVPESAKAYAYDDGPLPIGEGQTISQPYVVAYMAEAALLGPNDKLLEIGTGSGYAAAVMSHCCGEVYSIERIPELATHASQTLKRLGYDSIHVRLGDGSLGLEEQGPFDAIVVTAGAPQLPVSLMSQLAIGGRLVVPVGDTRSHQELIRATKESDERIRTEHLLSVRFVPLVGEEGW